MMSSVIGVLGLVALVVVFTLFLIIKKLLFVSTPNEALIFSGATRRLGERTVGYRFVRGGRSVRRPLVERVDNLDLSMFTIALHVQGAFSKGGIPLTIQGVANVKLPGEEPLLANAVERFLGRTREEIYYIAKETLEGNLRGVLASLTPEEVNEDKMRFAHTLLEEAEHDMSRMGIVLDTLKVQNVTDEVKYLSSIGRIRGATLNQEQAIAEAQARADASVQQAANWAASEVAKVDADMQIARQETAKRIADAKSRREALIQESRGEVVAQVAQVTAEIERQKARAPQEKLRLDADIVQPALAKQRAAEEAARGAAAQLVERGRAEAGSLKKVVEAYRAGGASSRDVLALQSLLPMLGQVAGARQGLAIAKLSVLPTQGDAAGADLARKTIGATEQIRAATGVDLAGVAKRFGG
ncbi:MAG: SPFH domain-containing protein [Sorangiineae bacterium]|nr:SPFH domain-containing protein [Polyangiaceae bacterium]MEB2323551.1 SPFH domain-containing protein [Sorangiineae bacterium]